MIKMDCVLIVSNEGSLEKTVRTLNLDKINLVSILLDASDKKFFDVSGDDVTIESFENIDKVVKNCKAFTWLISGYENESHIHKIKKFLMTFGIEEKNIVNFEAVEKFSPVWLANYNQVEKNSADFFATGDEYFRDALDLKLIPCVHKDKDLALGGVNLAGENQNLQQSYSIAKHIFAHVKPGTVKFVLIGLSPNYFYRDTAIGSFDFQNSDFFKSKASEQADLNFDGIKKRYDRTFSTQSILDWEEDLSDISVNSGEKNTQILRDYIKLCLDNGAKPVGVIFPFSSTVRKNYDEEILASFRETIHQLEEECNFFCVDMFDLNLDYRCFCDMLHFNLKGSMFINSILSMKLCNNNLIPAENFGEMSYRYLNRLAWVADKNDYSTFIKKIFSISAQKIRRKDKIKIGLVPRGSAEWCGDDLYNLFARDKRFEVTVFSFLEWGRSQDKLFAEDFWHGIEQFKQRGLNVVALDNLDASVPEQDIFIFLSPYFDMMPLSLQPENLTLKTLITHIPYSFNIALHGKLCCSAIFNTAWKVFFSSKIELEWYKKNNIVGMQGGVYGGYPRTDIFFKNDIKFQFKWKIARSDAKKIIYAPHWSVISDDKPHYATFRWNHKFMYEFARKHPEISFVYKPHPLLSSSAIREKVFPSDEAYEEYLQKWNDLPNAQVYTGAYYQDLFATSDGMIHDSGSFIAEYQFVNKPMIFLTREGEKFNKLGEEILKASYLVDGRDFEGIAAMMQKVFIEGDDYKAAERKAIFDKYLNYPKYNGMLASEFVYKSIADPLIKGDEK